ncbi:MAG: LVIVD repeat-containing protein [Pyrinomonadaceae bacterium]
MHRVLISFLFVFLATTLTAFAQQQPKPAPTLEPGMKGSDPTDPRAKLKPGMFDAGEAAFGMKHLTLFKKPDTFKIGSDLDDPKVQKALAQFGIPDISKFPKEQLPFLKDFLDAGFDNSDLAFQGNYLFQGNYHGIGIFDIAEPAKPKLLTAMLCPGGQGDVSVYKNLLFMSVEGANGRLDCGDQGFPRNPPGTRGIPAAQKDRFRGVRIFDISNISEPKQVAAIQTCRGSHTHTLVTDPKDKENVYIYVSGISFVRQAEELAGCSAGPPDKDANTALFRIEVIKVPVAAPQDARIVSTPRLFMDPKTGALNGLNDGGSHDSEDRKPQDTDQCHDITVYSELGLAAGACSGNGILLDIKDPANPKRIDAVNDPNYAYWHSASFSNDGSKVIFTDEWGGGGGPKCRTTDPNIWGANAVFNRVGNKLLFAAYYKLPAAQTETENCVAHNGSLIPVPGRDLKVQSWYQGGISVMDFTDAAKPIEVAYFDRGPINGERLISGGTWSAYWYNGYIYSSEIARGLDVLELVPNKYLTQNEIDAARSVRLEALNVQSQQRYVWPRSLTVAKAYLDQLERSKALPAGQIAALRTNIDKGDRAALKKRAGSLMKAAALSKSAADVSRLNELAAILNNPAL